MIKLNQNSKEAEQHFLTVKPLIQGRIRNILNSGINRNKLPVHLTHNFRNYLTSLLDDANLKTLILAKPNSFQGIIASLQITNPNFFVAARVENFVLRNIFISHCYDNNDFSKLDFIKNMYPCH